MATVFIGPRTWSMTRDDDGNREYKLKSLVRGDVTDGPANVLATEGLPVPGDEWNFFGDNDPWATCKQTASITPHSGVKEGSPFREWIVEQTFSSKGDEKRCKDEQIDDPLLVPQKVSGSFTKYQEEATHDRFGQPIVNSAWEQLRGPQVEFDGTRFTVKVEQNVQLLQLGLVASMRDCVNASELWGLPARCVKLANFTWEKKFYGKCNAYYTRSFEFEVRTDGFDRDLLDEGTKVLHGHWDRDTGNWVLDQIDGAEPDPLNPQHFDRFKDRNGENARVILNGGGVPADVVVGLHAGTGDLFISIIDDNVDQPLTDEAKWVRINGDPTNIEEWDPFADYVFGDIVSFTPTVPPGSPKRYFIATDDPFTGEPLLPAGGNWLEIPSMVVLSAGNYDSSTRYDIGDYVKDTTTKEEAGTIHVEKYGEADFTQLGIPTIL